MQDFETSRDISSLHIIYNQCIVQTTRPVFLHIFKSYCQRTNNNDFSPLTLALGDACVQAAIATSRILETLYTDGSIATFGYWEADHIYSSLMILNMSFVLKPDSSVSDSLQTILNVLEMMRNEGNIPAKDYYDRLIVLREEMTRLFGDPPLIDTIGAAATSDERSNNVRQDDNNNMDLQQFPDTLSNPLIGHFLDESRFSWANFDSLDNNDEFLSELPTEFEEPFLY